MGTIVVGVDGSPHSRRALRWAVEEAGLRAAAIRAVCVWSWPYEQSEIAHLAGASVRDALCEDADRTLDAAVRAAGLSTEAVERLVVEGSPAPRLIEAARDADLLVVGSRGRGGFAGLLLGSVSQHCAQGAPCPVVIVRHVAEPTDIAQREARSETSGSS